MIPAALSSVTIDPESVALSGLPFAVRSNEALELPGAPSFAGGLNPATDI